MWRVGATTTYYAAGRPWVPVGHGTAGSAAGACGATLIASGNEIPKMDTFDSGWYASLPLAIDSLRYFSSKD